MEIVVAVSALLIVGAGVAYLVFVRRGPARAPSPKPSVIQPSSSGHGSTAHGKQSRVVILFGSQTGTAEMYAKTLTREGHHLGVDCRLEDVENYKFTRLASEEVVVFVVATYGEGEPTDSMKEFFEMLMEESREPNELDGVKYAVFGLGDRQYKHFCKMGIDVDKRMGELGAKRIYGLGTGDAGRNIEEEFDTWRLDLWHRIAAEIGITLKAETEEPVEPELNMIICDHEPNPHPFVRMTASLEPTQKQPVYASVIRNDELLRNCHDRSTRHIELDISDTSISYQSGDHLGILPCNPDNVVNDYLKILGINHETAESVISLADKNGRNTLPARVTIRTALKWYIDLCGIPKKSALRAFAHYCTEERERDELLGLLRVNEEAQEKYHKLMSKVRTVFGVLRKFSSCKVPIGHFLELMPRLAPRYFSISSDQLRQGKAVHITVAVVHDGVCTTMLAHATLGDKIPVFVRKSNFHLPLRAKARPMIMIGPGTGVAPLIGFMHRRIAWKEKNNELGECLFFFGCRKRDEDFIHREFLESCVERGVISTLDVAFSREGATKDYVQHHIAARADDVSRIIKNGGNIYICGDAKHMAKDVERTLEEIIASKMGKTQEEAADMLQEMQRAEKFLKDVWSA